MGDAGWLLIIIPLFIFQLVQLATVLAFPVLGIWNAYTSNSPVPRVGWCIFAAVPLFFLGAINLYVAHDIQRREADLSSLQTVKIKPGHFKKLVVVGGARTSEIGILMSIANVKEALLFGERIEVLKEKGGKTTRYTTVNDSRCNTARFNTRHNLAFARELYASGFRKNDEYTSAGRVYKEIYYSDFIERFGRQSGTDSFNLEACLTETKYGPLSWETATRDALVLLSGHETSFKESNTLRGERFELRASLNGKQELVGYSESSLGVIKSQRECVLLWFECFKDPSEFRQSTEPPEFRLFAADMMLEKSRSPYVFDRDYPYHKMRRKCPNSQLLSASC